MLHRIVMVGLVVVGLVVAGLGVASATVWRPSDTAVMTTGEQSGATLLTTAPGVLSLVDRDVTITARSSDDAKVVLALGSQVDVDGWIGEDPALRVTGASDWETLTVAAPDSTGASDPSDAATDETAETDPAEPTAPGPDPSGSDMWVEATSGTGSATLGWDASSTDQVLLVAAVGEDAAAPQVTLSWPREVTTPLLWPGVALGVLLVALGLIYGLVTRGRRRRSTAKTAALPGPAAAQTPAGGTPAAGPLTRRQLREIAEREEVEAAAAAEAAPRQKRQWPWTGAIPVVKPAEDVTRSTEDEVPSAPEAHRPAWLPEGTGSTSGSSWRAAWGVRTPEPSAESAEDAGSAGTAGGADERHGAVGSSTAPAAARTTPAASSTRAATGTPASTTAAAASPAAAAPAPQRPAPRSSKPSADSPAPAGRPTATPPVRPVDQASPFQRITLRSSDESAPARRIRRDQQAPSSWSASRSPWAQPARPGTPAAPTSPRPAPGSEGASAAGPASDDAPTERQTPKTPTDDTTKDSD